MRFNKTLTKSVLKFFLFIGILTIIVSQQTQQQQQPSQSGQQSGQMGPPSSGTSGQMGPPSSSSQSGQMGPPSGSSQSGQMGPPSGTNGSSNNPSTTSSSETCGTTKEAKNLTYSITSDDAKGSATGYPGGYFQMNTDSCPNYDWTSQSTPNKALVINRAIKLPMQPKLSTQKIYVGIKGANGATNSNPVMGAIGVSVNGISIFGNANAEKADAYINESQTFDKCGGHPQMQGEYHYHEEAPSGCVTTDTAGKHSNLFGIMFDGIPIFGSLGDSGIAPTDLDECGGHVDKTYPFYHYHLPTNMAFPYTLSCLRGCIYDTNGNNQLSKYKQSYSTCTQDSKQYDYSPIYNNISNFVVQYKGTRSSTNTQSQTADSFLPPSTPTTSSKINNITNNTSLNKLKNLISNLPTAEQDIIADCINSNTDSTRLVDANCYKNNFSSTVRTSNAKGVGQVLTSNSQNNRQGLGCLNKVANTFGDSSDNSTQIINSDLTKVVSQQTSLNSALAAFSKTVTELFNAKRRQLLTTNANIEKVIASTDSQGNAEGLIFTPEEQKTLISSFTTYANFMSEYNSNYSSKVNSIQGMIGNLSQCKPVSNSSKRNLQAPPQGGMSGGMQNQGQSGPQSGGSSGTQNQGQSGQTQSGLQGGMNGGSSGTQNQGQSGQTQSGPQGGMNGGSSGTQNQGQSGQTQSGPQGGMNGGSSVTQNQGQSGQGSTSQKPPTTGTQQGPSGSGQGMQNGGSQNATMPSGSGAMGMGSGQNMTFPMGSGSQNMTMSGENQIKGGKPVAADGRPQVEISSSILSIKSTIIEKLNSKTSDPSWSTLSSKISTNLDSTSSYKPKPSLVKLISARLSNSDQVKTEFDKITKNTSCDKDYIYTCADGSCSCNDANCPSTIKGTTSVSINNNVNSLLLNNILHVNIGDHALRYLQSPTQQGGSQIQGGTQQGGMQQGGSQQGGSQMQGGMQQGGMQLGGMQQGGNQNDSVNSFYFCSICLSGQRFYYAEADLSNSGKSIDIGNGQGNGLGKDVAKQQNSCANTLATGSSSDKKSCRGNMNDECAKKLDDSCKSQGLYDTLVKNPVSSDPLPVECNNSLATYSDLACLQWLVPRISKGTLVLDASLLMDLPNQIAISNGAKSSGRLLASTATVKIGIDPSLSDSVAVLPANIYKLNDADLQVDSATATSIPSISTYINDFTTKAQSITLNSSYLNNGYLLLAIVFAIFFC